PPASGAAVPARRRDRPGRSAWCTRAWLVVSARGPSLIPSRTPFISRSPRTIPEKRPTCQGHPRPWRSLVPDGIVRACRSSADGCRDSAGDEAMPRSAARTTRPPETDPFPYGWRYVKKLLPDGSVDLEQVPLTLEDVLHPQLDDVMPENVFHERDAEYLCAVFRQRAGRLPGGFFLGDCLVNSGVPGIR